MITSHTAFKYQIYALFVCGMVCTCISYPSLVTAQFLAPTQTSGPQLEIDPRYPEPGSTVSVRYVDYDYAHTASLAWYVDGIKQVNVSGDTFTFVVPELGTPTTLEARTMVSTGPSRTAKKTIVPSEIDIIVEGDTTAPYFYQGRRVPSAGATARITAVAHLYDESGAKIPTSDITYTWALNNQVVRSNQGNNTLALTLSPLGDSLMTLSAETTTGVSFEKTFPLPVTTPTLGFYPLTQSGTLSRNAVSDRYLYAKDRVTLRAEPYFVSKNIYEHAHQAWTLNQQPVATNESDPLLITLQSGGAGVSEVGFSLQNLNSLSQKVLDMIRLEFQ